jgi:O-antigen/teichoic acid export membrane protein
MDIALGTLVMLLFRISGGFCWALAGVVTARTLSVGDRGTYVAAVLAIGALGHLAARLTAASGYLVANQKRPVPEVSANGIVMATVGGILMLLISLVVAVVVGGDDRVLIVLIGVGLAPSMLKGVLGGVFLAQGRLGWAQLAGNGNAWFGVVTLGIWVIVLGHRTPEHAVGAWVFGHYLALAFVLLGSGSWLSWLAGHGVSLAQVRVMLTFGASMTLVGVIAIVNFRLSQFFVLALDGREGVGMYASATTASEALWLVAGALAGASYARVGRLDRQDSARLTARTVRHSILTAAALGAILFFTAPLAITLVFGPEYQPAVTSARILAVAAVMFAGRISLWSYFTVQVGKPWTIFGLEALSLVLSSGLCLVFIPQVGFVGAAWATLATYAVTISVAAYLFKRSSGVPVSELWMIRLDDLLSYWRLARRITNATRGLPLSPVPARATEDP